jgi:hypothetical protein
MMALLAKQAEWRQRDAAAPMDAATLGVTPEWEHVGVDGVRVDGGPPSRPRHGSDDGDGGVAWAGGKGEDEGEGEGEGNEDGSAVDPELLHQLRALAVAGEDIPLEALPPDLLRAFMKAVSEGQLSGAIAGACCS